MSSPPDTRVRAFFAVWPPEETAHALHQWALAARESTGGRAVPAPNLHVTLAFLGEIGFDRLREAIDAGRRVIGEVHTLPIDAPGCWSRARIVWAGPALTPPGLGALAANLRRTLDESGFALDPRAFVPHVTLLRDASPRSTLPPLPKISWPVTGFALVRSARTSEGSRYENLRSFRIGRH
jgi:RNA 2',3'-cyclic 3'-phosphodiesterase